MKRLAILPAFLFAAPVQAQPHDFGDLPDAYGTLLPNGARHFIVPGFSLGTQPDAEADGAPGPLEDGDDTSGTPAQDDEDGLVALHQPEKGIIAW